MSSGTRFHFYLTNKKNFTTENGNQITNFDHINWSRNQLNQQIFYEIGN